MEDLIIYTLVLTSVVGLTVILERGFALRASRIIPPEVQGALEICRTTGDLPMLRAICQQNPSPLSRLLLQADERRAWLKAENASALEVAARHEMAKLDSRLAILEIIVGIAPLMGLVGTIYGLITLFGGLSGSGLADNGAVASGIALALHATLLGLLTAIPSLIGWSFFNKKVEHFAVEMAALCDEFLIRQYHQDDDVAADAKPARRQT